MRHKASNWLGSPACGVAVSSRTRLESDRDRVHGRPARRPERRAVRFVHDEHVPVGLFQRAQHFGLLDEVERRDVNARQDPGVHIRRQLAAVSREPRRAGHRRREVETIGKLPRPLLAEPRGRDDERAERFPLEGALVEDDPRLDGFPEADGVRNHQARNAQGNHRERGFQLIRQEFDGAPGRPLQPAGGVRARRRPPQRVEPPARPDDADRLRTVQAARAIEGDQQCTEVAVVSRPRAREAQRVAAGKRREPGDGPGAPPDEDALSRLPAIRCLRMHPPFGGKDAAAVRPIGAGVWSMTVKWWC